jgi:hypothetical protein
VICYHDIAKIMPAKKFITRMVFGSRHIWLFDEKKCSLVSERILIYDFKGYP